MPLPLRNIAPTGIIIRVAEFGGSMHITSKRNGQKMFSLVRQKFWVLSDELIFVEISDCKRFDFC